MSEIDHVLLYKTHNQIEALSIEAVLLEEGIDVFLKTDNAAGHLNGVSPHYLFVDQSKLDKAKVILEDVLKGVHLKEEPND